MNPVIMYAASDGSDEPAHMLNLDCKFTQSVWVDEVSGLYPAIDIIVLD